ncbi:MAG: hypothetical protein PHX25_02305 [Candidatus Pacebacteria bacterium]|nr:hypothetical protein [Candidatus Paceibacterota bacterium]
MKKKEIVLPQIKFKYSSLTDENGERLRYPDETCYFCGKDNIIFGGIIDAHRKNPKIMCENCAIKKFAKDNGYKTLKVASARRRRLFDVSYLFTDMITERYLKKHEKFNLDDISEKEYNMIVQIARDIFNAIDRNEKERIEEIFDQKDIEKELNFYIKDLFK